MVIEITVWRHILMGGLLTPLRNQTNEGRKFGSSMSCDGFLYRDDIIIYVYIISGRRDKCI